MQITLIPGPSHVSLTIEMCYNFLFNNMLACNLIDQRYSGIILIFRLQTHYLYLQMKLSRRRFFRNAGLGAASLAGIPLLASGCESEEKERIREFLSRNDTVLFQGDSITDAGRDRNNEWANFGRSLGTGYALLLAAKLLNMFPELDLKIYNRGISGNKVYQLQERWQKDCIDLKPDVLSILIGVNDYWHMRDGHYDGTTEVYQADFKKLLEETKTALPGVKLVICQPFILTNTSAVDQSWVEPFKVYQQIAQEICDEFDALWVPFQDAFSSAVNLAPEAYWTQDGVHPSTAGAQLMADTWMNSFSKG